MHGSGLDLDEGAFAPGYFCGRTAKGFRRNEHLRSESFKETALALEPDAVETHHQLSMVYSHVAYWTKR
jgi:hypothetical protein